MNSENVLKKLKPIAERLSKKHSWLKGKKSLLLAQIIVESNWLKSMPGNNALGIKWTPKDGEDKKQMLWTKEFVNGKYIRVLAAFKKFNSLEECIEDGYIRILSLNRYKETRESIDWWDATNYIRINGYATSKSYSDTLRNFILKHKLYVIDWRHDYDELITSNFKYGETFSNVRVGRKTYRRVIENPPKYDENRQKLIEQLQIGRDYVGKPFVVTPNGCCYRITEYNFQVRGAKESQHLFANAGDIYTPRGFTTYQFYKIMRKKTDGTGYGIGSNFLHFDRKKNVRTRVWSC